MIELAAIKEASGRIADKVLRTPLLSSRTLGEQVGVSLYLKCECFQKTGSFKARGALNKVMCLSEAERARGLITVSAGNHAQAVAWAAHYTGASCVVVMPADAPLSKIDAVRAYGADVVVHNDRATLFDKLDQEQELRGSVFVHPFDDATVLAGAGTVGLEIVEDLPQVDIVVVPVGGGGLMGGVASAIKALRPRARVVAVELEAGPGLGPALEAGMPVAVTRPAHTLADGMTPPFVGNLPLEIARQAVDDVVMVRESELVATMRLLMTRAKLCVEASGAAATAALLFGKIKTAAGDTVATVVSGGNIDLDSLCAVLQRET
ncbi:MAG: pyridoxal-phosphate dependent enzyme [Candidatus Krumholzibacteria bacterium]|nr:pyridoxal-phosphate dependent enzyme [Candidatus Krumholzibacteria bacterium]